MSGKNTDENNFGENDGKNTAILDRIKGEFWKRKLLLDQADYFTLFPRKNIFTPKQTAPGYQIVTSPIHSASQIRKNFAPSDVAQCTFLVASLQTLLFRYSEHENCALQTPFLHLNESDQITKSETNHTILLNSTISSDQSFKQVLSNTKNEVLSSYQNQASYQEAKKRSQTRLPNICVSKSGIQDIEHLDLDQEQAPQLLIHWTENDEFLVKYKDDVAPLWFITQLLGHLNALLDEVIQNIDIEIKQLTLLNHNEKKRLVTPNEPVNFPQSNTIVSVFEQQVLDFPQRIALKYGEEEISYEALNKRANQIAHFLISNGLQSNDLVSVILDRSIEMIVALLGTLKAGGAYVPIDPDYPIERQIFTIEDSNSRYLITSKELEHELNYDGQTLFINELSDDDGLEMSGFNPTLNLTPDQSAYVIYTSGTTGKPKGVVITHRNLIRLFFTDNPIFDFSENDVWSMFHSYCFDFSVWEMYGALLFGGKLIIVPKESAQNPTQFHALCTNERVTILNQTPGAFYNFMAVEDSDQASESDIRKVIFGGEALNPTKLIDWLNTHPNCDLINMYGITETTVHVTYKKITQAEIESGQSNIGKPIPTLSMHVMDSFGNLTPMGVPGELYISGEGLAKEYLNRPELTEERFISHPLFPDGKLYRSGDLARLLENGEFEYLGRTDQQVKIRGFRIETGEIENVLLQHADVGSAIVTSFKDEKDGNAFLVAYYLNTTSNHIESGDFRNFTGKFLPDYMIPSHFIEMEEFPLTSNGKIDKKRLPNPSSDHFKKNEYVKPVTDLHWALVEIWNTVLGLGSDHRPIGIRDNFFELGGHSLRATVILSKVNKQFLSSLRVRDIFLFPTIEEFAIQIGNSNIEPSVSLQVVDEQEHYSLSFSQKQVWIVQELDQENIAYNLFGSYRLLGDLNLDALNKAFQSLILRHDALRSHFFLLDGEPRLGFHSQLDFNLEMIDLTSYSKEAQNDEVASFIGRFTKKPFNLTTDPLIRAAVIRLNSKEQILSYGMHHIISDGWTMNIIFDEVTQLYNHFASGENHSLLQPLKYQYKDFLAWEGKMLEDNKRTEYQNFWKGHFAQGIKSVALPYDYPKPVQQTYEGSHHHFNVEPAQVSSIYSTAKELGVTLNVFLLSAYTLFLSKISGDQESISIRSITTGRNHEDLAPMVGYFIRVFGIQNYVIGSNGIKAFIQDVNDRFINVLDHNIYPYEQVLKDLNPSSQVVANEINVDFALQNLGTIRSNIANKSTGLSGIEVQSLANNASIARNDLLLTVFEDNNGERLEFDFNYNVELFSPEKIEWFASCFSHLLNQITETLQLKQEDRTLQQLALSNGTNPALFNLLKVSEKNYEKLFPLTTTQRDIYLDCLINPEGTAHQLALYTDHFESIDTSIWKETLMEISSIYEVLRSEILSNGVETYQAVKNYHEDAIPFKFVDLSDESLNQDEIHARMMEIALRKNALDGELCRFYLIKVSEQHFINLIGIHHIFFDGVSGKIFFELCSRIYQSKINKQEYSLPLVASFETYARQHNALFDTSQVRDYWINKFSALEPLECIHDERKEEHVTEKLLLNPTDLQQVTSWCETQRISVPMFFKGVFALAVRNYCNAQSDFYIRELLSGQSEEFKNTLGCFYQTLPTVLNTSIFQESIFAFFTYLKGQKKELGNNQNTSIFLQNQLLGEEHVYFYFNFSPFYKIDTVNGSGFYRESENTSEKDVELKLEEIKEGYQFRLDYNKALFQSNRFIERIIHVSKQIVSGLNHVSELDFSLPDEQSIESALSNSTFDYPPETIQESFAQSVASFPNHVAVKFADRELTYSELDERSNQLAHYILAQKEIKPDMLIGLLVGRSERMIVGLLGILKSGAAYVPIDPEYPTDRIQHMISDSGIDVLVIENDQNPDVYAFSGQIINLQSKDLLQFENTKLSIDIKPAHLAYVIYTSGSTGLPKGSLIEHRNVISLLKHDRFQFDFNEKDVWTLFHSFCFDFSIWEIFGALLYGGRLTIVPKEIAQQPEEYARLLEREQVTILNQIPSIFSTVSAYFLGANLKNKLRYIIFGGEALKPATLVNWFKKHPKTRLINMYGITETTVHVTYKEITSEEIHSDRSNVGQAIPSLNCVILGPNLKPLPHGLAGEICIYGAGLSRGYIGNPELTKHKFIVNPTNPSERLYRSGDLGLIAANGDIEYLGRMDQQVKVRGFRIELGEIEHVLLNHNSISDVVVRVITNNNNQENEIRAYLISNESQLDVQALRNYVSASLPEYMVPSWFIPLTEFPKTPIGKIDYKALPEPSIEPSAHNANWYKTAPETQQSLVHIWSSVLNIAPQFIGLDSSFFELGGQSLKAAQLINQIEKKLGLKIPLRQLFSYPTIRSTAQYLEEQVQPTVEKIKLIKAEAKKPWYPVSAAQKRLYIIDQFDHIGTTYNMPVVLQLRGVLDIENLRNSLYAIVERHESFRTSFQMEEGQPVQIIHSMESVEWQMETATIEHKLLKPAIRAFIKPFDLTQASLFRANLITIQDNPQDHLLIIDLHHIAGDGFSNALLFKEFTSLYQGIDLEPLKFQYKDFALYQQRLSQSEIHTKQQKYWLDVLTKTKELQTAEFPLDYSRPAQLDYDAEVYYSELTIKQSAALRNLANENQATLFSTMLSVYGILLRKYSSDSNIIVGTPVSGRTNAEVEGIIGMFVNTLALSVDVDLTQSFQSFLQTTSQHVLDAFDNQDYQLEDLLEALDLPRDLSRNPLFDSTLSVQNIDFSAPTIPNLNISSYGAEIQNTKFDLTIDVLDSEAIGIRIAYRSALFKPESIARFVNQMGIIIDQIIENPTVELNQIALMDVTEKQRILHEFNEIGLESSDDSYTTSQISVLALFEHQVTINPNAIAVEFGTTTLSYQELDQVSNQLARFLGSNYELNRNDLVGILLDRSEKMIVALFACWKAGTAYLPIDPSIPTQRIESILHDAVPKVILTDRTIDTLIPCFNLSNRWNEVIQLPNKSLKLTTVQSDIAYVIYTSGSTGKPKGCVLSHGNLTHYIHWANGRYFGTEDGNFGLYTSIAFDLTITSIFTTLSRGKRLFVYPPEMEITEILAHSFEESSAVDSIKITPAHIRVLKHLPIESSSMKTAIIGGEQLSIEQVKILQSICPDIRIFNEYGPTETTVGCVVKEIESTLEVEKITIGNSIAQTKVYVLDSVLQPVSIGIPGELYIAGPGVGQGYLNKPELTTERFVSIPELDDSVLYKTGDLVRWDSAGELEFLGRLDEQVKIRGYRIELGEIEYAISQLDETDQCVVIIQTDSDGEAYLCAYVVQKDKDASIEYAQQLSEVLPAYMIPSIFVSMDKIPLTTNGKVNKNALPNHSITQDAARKITEVQSETEIQLLDIWQSVLKLEHIGADENFFQLGGHSLKATQVISEVYKLFGKKIPLKSIFTSPTIQQLSNVIDQVGSQSFQSIPKAVSKELYPLSNAQKRLWLIHQMDKSSTAYNMGKIFEFTGKVNQDALQKTIGHLIERHEILRTVFVEVDGNPFQKILPITVAHLNFQQLEEHSRDSAKSIALEEWNTPFDLVTGPLVRAKLIQFGKDTYFFTFFMHHINGDGSSVQVIMHEIAALYNAFANNTSNPLSELAIQHRDYSEWMNERLTDDEIERQQTYWKSKFSGQLPAINLPYDFKRPLSKTYAGDSVSVSVDVNTVADLEKWAHQSESSLFMIFLTVLNGVLYRFSDQQEIIIGTPIDGRSHPDLEGMIGFLVNTLAIKTKIKEHQSFRALSHSVRENLLEDYANQEYPFDHLVEELSLDTTPGRSPVFDVMFAMQGMANGEDTGFSLQNINVSSLAGAAKVSQFDLVISASVDQHGAHFHFVFNTDLFLTSTVNTIAESFQLAITASSLNPDIEINKLSFKNGSKSTNTEIQIVDPLQQSVPSGIIGFVQYPGQSNVSTDKGRLLSDGKLELYNAAPYGFVLNGSFQSTESLYQTIHSLDQVVECKIVNHRGTPYAFIVASDEKINQYDEGFNPLTGIEVVLVPNLPLTIQGTIDLDALVSYISISTKDVSLLESKASEIYPVHHFTGLLSASTHSPGSIHMSDVLSSTSGSNNSFSKDEIEDNDSMNLETNINSEQTDRFAPAQIDGKSISITKEDALTLSDALIQTSQKYPDKGIIFINSDGTEQFQSYPKLLNEARRVANGLQHSGLQSGDAVILQIEHQKDYFSILWGCICTGVIPVTVAVSPTYEEENSIISKLYNIWTLLDQPTIICSDNLADPLSKLPTILSMESPRLLNQSELVNYEPLMNLPKLAPSNVAYYQLSSGSTGIPKCIPETNEAIIRHIIGSRESVGFNPRHISCNWIPFDHVGSLLMFHTRDLYLGIHQIQLGSDNFLGDPLRWLNTMEKHKVTHSWAPNFGYKLVSEAIIAHPDQSWDLSKIEYLMNGGEQVTLQVVQSFLERTHQFGLNPSAITPAYGMAEVCTALTYLTDFSVESGHLNIAESSLNDQLVEATSADAKFNTFICCGVPRHDSSIRITDENNQLISQRKIGRIQILTPSRTSAYLKNSEANEAAFLDDQWYNTGDLGFIWDGRLYVTGREKEMIIIRGTHYYFFEIEDLVNEIAGVEPTFVGSSAVDDKAQGTEGLAIFFVPNPAIEQDLEAQIEVIREIKTKITSTLGIRPSYIVPVQKSEFPKTTSGKIQRNALKVKLKEGAFHSVLREIDLLSSDEELTVPNWFYEKAWVPKQLLGPMQKFGTILVFTNEEAHFSAFCQEFQKEEPTRNVNLIQIAFGDNFGQPKPHKYVVKADQLDNYTKLFDSIEANKNHPAIGIVHYWSLEEPTTLSVIDQHISSFDDAQKVGLQSLTLLSKVLQRRTASNLHKVVCFTPGSQGSINLHATLPGFIKTLNQEISHTQFQLIHWNSNASSDLTKIGSNELLQSNSDEEINYSNGTRRIAQLIKADVPSTTLSNNQISIKKGGLYLISGALGGIGKLLSEHLITHYQTNLLLFGRSEIPATIEACAGNLKLEEKFIALKQLKQLRPDVEIIYMAVDINDLPGLTEFVDKFTVKKENTLDGIIHLAGELNDINLQWESMESNTIEQIDYTDYTTIFATKVFGTLNLTQLLDKHPSASFIGFSTVNSFFGGYGYAPYSAASSFMDTCFADLNEQGKSVKIINWSMWDDIGINENNQYKSFTIDKGFHAISEIQGINSFETALQHPSSQLIVGINGQHPFIQRSIFGLPKINQDLVLFYEADSKLEFLSGQLKSFLPRNTHLSVKQLDALPRKSNDQVDKNSLYAQIGLTNDAGHYIKPETSTEIQLAAIWSDLLNKSKVGAEDNFFELGGDSLKATQLANRIHKSFEVAIELRSIFAAPSVRQLAVEIDTTDKGENQFQTIEPLPFQKDYALSPAQNRMFILNQLDPQGTGYNMPGVYKIKGGLDPKKVEQSFLTLIERHESLRTTFELRDGNPAQIIHPTSDLRSYFDLKYMKVSSEEEALQIRDQFVQSFDLGNLPLFRACLVEISSESFILMTDMHHIVSDGISISILIDEFMRLYQDQPLTPLRLQYKDFASWQLDQSNTHSKPYWVDRFKGEIPDYELPIDTTRPSIRNFDGATHSIKIGPKITSKLKQLNQKSGTTLFMSSLAVLNVLISKLVDSEDIIIGTPIAGRSHADLEPLIGMFVNSLALRNTPSKDWTFQQFLESVKENTIQDFEHQHFPLEDLLDELKIPRDTSRNPLFDVFFAVQNVEFKEVDQLDLGFQSISSGNETVKFDLSIAITESGDTQSMVFAYSKNLFSSSTIERIADQYQKLLAEVVSNPAVKLGQLELISSAEKEHFIKDASFKPTDHYTGILDRLSKTANAFPANKAVQFESKVISFEQLILNIKKVRDYLNTKSIESGDCVALLMDKSDWTIACTFGIMANGNTLIPIDPTYPNERIQYILSDSKACALLTDKSQSELTLELNQTALLPLSEVIKFKSIPSSSPDLTDPKASETAYIIYTSGTTGNPKGVQVSHGNLASFTDAMIEVNSVTDQDAMPLIASNAFDISFFEILNPLLNGGSSIVLTKAEILNAGKLRELLKSCTLLHTVPALMRQIIDDILENGNRADYEHVRELYVGGDLVPIGLLEAMQKVFINAAIKVLYGPTEGTIFCTVYAYDGATLNQHKIGTPISNAQILILNSEGKIQPIGVTGEICIAGAGVTQGYLNQPELTEEKYIRNPYNANQLLYKTGDLARWNEFNELEFIGRSDNQVKIRGFRIELGEIENQLTRHEEIQDAVVLNKKDSDGNAYLSSFVVRSKKLTITPSLAEYFVYDDMAYTAMTKDEKRNDYYRRAFRKVLKGKIVLDVGTGPDAILSRLAIECGAKRVYSVDILKETYEKAKKRINDLGLSDRIHLINGDITTVELPEEIDYCISEIVGSIGGSEGAAKLINATRRLLKNPSNMLPTRSLTEIAAVYVPEASHNFKVDEISKYYIEKIFDQIGHRFDLRMCVDNLPMENVLSNHEPFEDLDYTNELKLEDSHRIRLNISKKSNISGFVVWLNLYVDDDECMDTLNERFIWLPVYLPVFPEGTEAEEGDFIEATIIRTLADNGLNPDFEITGELIRKNENESIPFTYHSVNHASLYKQNDFYKRLFSKDEIEVESTLSLSSVKSYLKERIPEYMIPSTVHFIDSMPLTANQKVDRKALMRITDTFGSSMSLKEASSPIQKQMSEIWKELLKVDQVGANSNFFELGGHSLKATQLIARIHKEMQLEVLLHDVFDHPVLEDLCNVMSGASKRAFEPIPILNNAPYYDVSYSQNRLWILDQVDPNSALYNMPLSFVLKGSLDVTQLENAFNQVIDRHESLRTNFIAIEDVPKQVIHAESKFKLKFEDLSNGSSASDKAQKLIEAEASIPFDLKEDSLIRSLLIKEQKDQFRLIFVMHHIISDGWSMGQFMNELMLRYSNQEGVLEPLNLQYKDFASWQNTQILSDQKQHKSYWNNKLNGDLPTLTLPYDLERPNKMSFKGQTYSYQLEPDLASQINAFCKTNNVSLYTLMLSVVNVLLHRYSNQNDLLIGSPNAGRNHPDLANQLGFYVNTIVLRTKLESSDSFQKLLKDTHQNVLESLEHEMYPYDKLVEDLGVERASNRNPLFDVMLSVQNLDNKPKKNEIEGLKITTNTSNFKVSKFDLTFIFSEHQEKNEIRGGIEYSTDLFKKDSILEMSVVIEKILSQILENPEIEIAQIQLTESNSEPNSDVSDLDEDDMMVDFDF